MVERHVSLDPEPPDERLEHAQPIGPEREWSRPPRRLDVPEADALDQAEDIDPVPRPRLPTRGFEVPEADAWDQAIEVPIDDDWV